MHRENSHVVELLYMFPRLHISTSPFLASYQNKLWIHAVFTEILIHYLPIIISINKTNWHTRLISLTTTLYMWFIQITMHIIAKVVVCWVLIFVNSKCLLQLWSGVWELDQVNDFHVHLTELFVENRTRQLFLDFVEYIRNSANSAIPSNDVALTKKWNCRIK